MEELINLIYQMARSNLNHQPAYLEWLRKDLADCESILELGCGLNSPLLKIGLGKKTYAVDKWKPYIDRHLKSHNYRECWQADILTMPFALKGWDAVVLCDVLEHLPKHKVISRDLFSNIEYAAKKKIIIFGPNGKLPNGITDSNPFQKHESYWEPEDYLKRGYKVRGATGLRYILGEYGHPKYKPEKLVAWFAMVTQPFIYYLPKHAFQSYAIKEVK